MAKTLNWGETFKVLLDVGFLTDAFTLDSSLLDGTDVLDGSTDFVDITEYVQSININRGRTSQLDTFNPGTLSIVADDRASGRQFDPLNTASPWYEGDLGIAPRRRVEVYGGSAGTAALYKGYVYDLNIEYDEPNLSTATILAVDALAQLGQTNLNAFNPSSQLTSARVSAILDRSEVAWSTALRDIDTGVATCGTFAYEDQTNVLQALQAVQLAENGRLFANRLGQVEFDARITSTFATAVANLGGTAVTDIPIQALSNIYGAETVLNRVSVQISGGTASSVASGTASQTEYGIKNFSLTDIPLVNDTAGSALASALLNTYQNPEVRFDEATILVNPLSDAQIETMAALEIGDVLTVTKNFTTGSPTSITKNVVIEGIQHVVTPSRHDVRLRLGQIDVLTPFILSGYTTTTTRTNLVTNPNFETNTTGWAAASSTVSRITTASFIGSACMQMTSTSASDTTARTAYDPNTTMIAGQSLTASFYLYNYAGNNRQHRVDIRCFTSGGGVAGIITGTATTINVGAGWTRLSVTGTTPANTASLDVAIFCQVNNPSLSNVTYIDAVMLETGSTLLPYFDGTYADTYSGYTLTSQAWTGTADASTSTATWGLTSSYVAGSELDDPTIGLY